MEEERGLSYRDAGVDIDRADAALADVRQLIAGTHRPEVVELAQGFAGLFRLPGGIEDPVLAACCDGVGTKALLARETGRWRGLGIDLVAMNVNDLICHGAQPLFFLDYVATARLDPVAFREVLAGIADGCRQAGCALLGGETAEMPGALPPGALELAGFAVGVVGRSRILDGRQTIQAGDVVLGLASSGPHANGYSLVRRILAETGLALDQPMDELGGARLGECLLAPTRIYVEALAPVLAQLEPKMELKALVHITGGGRDNLKRVLPPGLRVAISEGSWPVPPIFNLLQARGGVEPQEMARVFNLGIGMALIVAPAAVDRVEALLDEPVYRLGEVVAE